MRRADFRFLVQYRDLVELAAMNFPPEHWNEDRIHTSFQALGHVCCVAKSSLGEVRDIHGYVGIADYSVVRVLVLVKDRRKVKSKLVVNNPVSGVDGIADVRVVEH
jgi:hypothetical protein